MRRKKIKIKKIEDISARQVTFSKRRKGLVKKARELSILCEAEVAVTVVSMAGRHHQYSSSNINDTLNKFSQYLDSERHLVRPQEEQINNVNLSTGVEEKIKYLRLIRSEHLQKFSPEELQSLETKLEEKLQYVTAKKRELLTNEVPALQTEDSQAAGTSMSETNREGLGSALNFPFTQITGNFTQCGSVNYISERWVPPPPDFYKVNFAGATFQDIHASGVGVVVRTHGGGFMAALTRFFPELIDCNTTSLMAAKCAVEFSVDYYFTNIVLEGDDQDTINEFKNTYENRSLGSNGIMDEAMSHMRQLGSCLFSHVQRSCNDVAHAVAQCARNVGDDEIVWLMKEPDFLVDILLADVGQSTR